MPTATASLNCRIPLPLAEALDAEARRSGQTKTEIVVAALTAELTKEANQMTITFQHVNDCTGFANGDEFTSDEQVRGYFTVANITDMLGECPQTQAELDDMADAVITNRWHYAEEA